MSEAHRTLMTHMIPFFPSRDQSMDVARGMIDGGSRYIEIQFPFSDPTADGPTIQGASATALANGFTVAEGWQFVREVVAYVESRSEAATAPVDIFVMSYASPVFSHGVETFVATAASIGVRGLIVPDLPIDYDEGLYETGRTHGVAIVPVIALGATTDRIALTKSVGSDFIYASLRRGTTGAYTEIGEENIAFLESLTSPDTAVVAGFGISTPEQVAAVLDHADAVVIGSAFVRCVERAVEDGRPVYEAILSETHALVSAPVDSTG